MHQSNLAFLKSKSFIIVIGIVFLMLLTRGSHVLTSVSLPDASLALLLIGGLYLRKTVWFVFFVLLATLIDFGAAEIDSFQAFCLTPAYWGMLPTYAVMWFSGVWLSKQVDPLQLARYAIVGVLATTAAFVISTQTYYLFSNRFPAQGIIESMQHGWEYLPTYLGFTVMYLASFWLLAKALPKLQIFSNSVKV